MKIRLQTRLAAMVVLCAMCVMVLISTVPAQETAEFKPEVAPKEKSLTLLELILAGGITMVPLGLLSVAVLSLVVRNFIALKEEKLLRPDLIPEMAEAMAERDVDEARQLCLQNPTLVTAVVGAGLDRVIGEEIDIEAIKEAIEEAGTEEMMTYMTPINYLSIIGAVSPMLGLLGTVSGMIKAFQNISVGGMGKAELLAANIGEALVTTATGLIIAIPAMIFYFIFKNRFMRILATTARISGMLLDTLKVGMIPESLSEDEVEVEEED